MKKTILLISFIFCFNCYSQETIESLGDKIKVYYKSLDKEIIESSLTNCNLVFTREYENKILGLTKNKIDMSKVISMRINGYQLSESNDMYYSLVLYLKEDGFEYEVFYNLSDYKSNKYWKKGNGDGISIITIKERRDLVVRFQELIIELAELCGSQNIINFD